MAVTDAQYAAFIDRLIVCREAEDAAKADTREVYSELAEAGEDKTAAGLIVRGLRMTAKDRSKAQLRDAAVESGLDRYNRGKASHVRAREAQPDHDADGVIIEFDRSGKAGNEGSPAPLTQQGFATPDSLGNEVGRPQSATLQSEMSVLVAPQHVDTAAVGTPSRATTPAQTESVDLSLGGAPELASVEISATSSRAIGSPAAEGVPTSLAGAEGDGDRQPVQESTAARKDVRVTTGATQVSSLPAVARNLEATHGGPVAPNQTAGTQAPPVDTHSEPVPADNLPAGTAAGARSAAPSPSAAPGVSNVTPFRTHNPETHFLNSKGLLRLHGCMQPEACAGSHRALCHSCGRQLDGNAA